MQRPADAALMLQYLNGIFHIAGTLIAVDSSARLDNIDHVACWEFQQFYLAALSCPNYKRYLKLSRRSVEELVGQLECGASLLVLVENALEKRPSKLIAFHHSNRCHCISQSEAYIVKFCNVVRATVHQYHTNNIVRSQHIQQ